VLARKPPLFADDLAKLGTQLSADVSKTSAMEIAQPASGSQGPVLN
jgi:hypothetical protein